MIALTTALESLREISDYLFIIMILMIPVAAAAIKKLFR